MCTWQLRNNPNHRIYKVYEHTISKSAPSLLYHFFVAKPTFNNLDTHVLAGGTENSAATKMKKAVVMEGVDPDGDEKPNESRTKAFGAMFDSMVPLSKDKKIVETAVMKMKRGVGRTKEEEGVKEVMEGEAVEAKVTPRQGQLSLAWSPFLCTFIALNKFTQTILTGRSCQKVETRDGQSHQSVWPSSISFLTRLKFHACSCRGSRHLQPELEIPAMLCMHFQEMRWEPWLAQPSAELSNTLPDKWKLDHLRWLYL